MADILKSSTGSTSEHLFHLKHPEVTVMLEFSSFSVLSKLDEGYDRAVKFIEEAPLPWYLKTAELYKATKTQAVTQAAALQSLWAAQPFLKVAASSSSASSSEAPLQFLESFATYLRTATDVLFQATAPLLRPAEVAAVGSQVDELLSTHFAAFDEKVDGAKVVFAGLLRRFKLALQHHAEVVRASAAKSYEAGAELVEKASEQAAVAVSSSSGYLSSKYPRVTRALLESYSFAALHAERLPLPASRGELLANVTLLIGQTHRWLATQDAAVRARAVLDAQINASLSAAQARTQALLVTAQPYVQVVVRGSEPYVAQAARIATTEPVAQYVARASQLLLPLATRADAARVALETNAVSGPYVEVAVKEGWRVLDGVKAYCWEAPVASAAVSVM